MTELCDLYRDIFTNLLANCQPDTQKLLAPSVSKALHAIEMNCSMAMIPTKRGLQTAYGPMRTEGGKFMIITATPNSYVSGVCLHWPTIPKALADMPRSSILHALTQAVEKGDYDMASLLAVYRLGPDGVAKAKREFASIRKTGCTPTLVTLAASTMKDCKQGQALAASVGGIISLPATIEDQIAAAD